MRWTIPLYAIKWCILSLQFKGISKKENFKIEKWDYRNKQLFKLEHRDHGEYEFVLI